MPHYPESEPFSSPCRVVCSMKVGVPMAVHRSKHAAAPRGKSRGSLTVEGESRPGSFRGSLNEQLFRVLKNRQVHPGLPTTG